MNLRTPQVLALAWQQYPVMFMLLSLMIALKAGRIRNKTSQLGRILYVAGLMANLAAVAANKSMHVVGMPRTGAASAFWQPASPATHLWWLVDNQALSYYSIGDIVLLCGGGLIITSWLYHKTRRKYEPAQVDARR